MAHSMEWTWERNPTSARERNSVRWTGPVRNGTRAGFSTRARMDRWCGKDESDSAALPHTVRS
jgi:hypothetical protein